MADLSADRPTRAPAAKRRRKPSIRKQGRLGHKQPMTLGRIHSAITNGSAILDQVDHRSAWMRRLRDLIDAHTSDLSGDDNISSGERSLIRRAAMLTLQLEMMETRWAANDGEASEKQLHTYQTATNSLRRTLESLGLQRRMKTVQSFGTLLREDAERQQREDAERNERKRQEFEQKQREQREAPS